jgi:predicted TIM-barrel fold metal-dependent hydrolase
MTVIAIEEHWNLPELTSAVRALPDDRGDESIVLDELGDNLERLDDIGEARIAAMDAQGIDVQILSLAPPGTQPLDPADALPLAMRANDIAAEAVRRHPARFRAFATLPMADARRAAAELERTAVSASSEPWSTGAPARPRWTTRATTTCSPRPLPWVSPSSSTRRSRHARSAKPPTAVSTP